jgi:hypothetical protein
LFSEHEGGRFLETKLHVVTSPTPPENVVFDTEAHTVTHTIFLDVTKELRTNHRFPSACSGPGSIDYKEYNYDGGPVRDYGDRYNPSWGGGTGGSPPGYRGPTSYLSYLYDRNGSNASGSSDQGGGSSSSSNRISTVGTESDSSKTTPPTKS